MIRNSVEPLSATGGSAEYISAESETIELVNFLLTLEEICGLSTSKIAVTELTAGSRIYNKSSIGGENR